MEPSEWDGMSILRMGICEKKVRVIHLCLLFGTLNVLSCFYTSSLSSLLAQDFVQKEHPHPPHGHTRRRKTMGSIMRRSHDVQVLADPTPPTSGHANMLFESRFGGMGLFSLEDVAGSAWAAGAIAPQQTLHRTNDHSLDPRVPNGRSDDTPVQRPREPSHHHTATTLIATM